jgi:DNA modification methylase
MFSFHGDTVLDPFMGTGTTLLAAAYCGRDSIGVEIEESFVKKAKHRLEKELSTLFRKNKVSLAIADTE